MLGRQTTRRESARSHRATRRQTAPVSDRNATNAQALNAKPTASENSCFAIPTVPKLAAAYARVSTERHEQQESIPSQLDALHRAAAERGYDLPPEFLFIDDGYSGARLDRPALDRLRDRVSEGAIEVVLVVAPDRLERVCKLHPISDKGIGQANERIPTSQSLFPIHHEAAEAIMPSVCALDLPAPCLAPRMDHGIFCLSPFGSNMARVTLEQKHLAGGGIVKGGIQTQMVRLLPLWLGADNGQGVEHQRQHRPVIHIGRRAHRTQGHASAINQEMLFIAGFGAVGGIGPGLFFPPQAPGQRSRRRTAMSSRCRVCHRRDGDTAPTGARKSPPAATRQSGRRPFARARTPGAAGPATDSPSTARRASR